MADLEKIKRELQDVFIVGVQMPVKRANEIISEILNNNGIVDTVDRISRLSFYDINYKVTSSREKRSGKTVKMVRIIA
jgi:hypothetical protein